MFPMDLIDYIKAQEQRGYTQEQIVYYLMQYGYDQNTVMQAVNAINQERMGSYESEAKISLQDVIRNPGAMLEALKDSLLGSSAKGAYAKGEAVTKAYAGKVIAVLVIILIVGGISYGVYSFINRPVCGNGEVEEGEDSQSCCADAGCIGDQVCTPEGCEDPICGECEYLENHRCIRHECCRDSDCVEGEKCELNECVAIECGECEYLEGRFCKPYECCEDTDCDDGRDDTIDRCEDSGTLNSSCAYESENPCETDADCDDGDEATKDVCEGVPKSCTNTVVVDCISEDGLCPEGCSYGMDTDCEECGNEVIGPGEQCDDGDDDAFDQCTNECQYNELYSIETGTAPGEMFSITWDFGSDFEKMRMNLEVLELGKDEEFSFYLYETTIGENYVSLVLNNSGARLISDASIESFDYSSPSISYNKSNVSGVFTPMEFKQGYYSLSIDKHNVDDEAWYKFVLTEKAKAIHTWCGSFRSDSELSMYGTTRFIFPGTRWDSQQVQDIPPFDLFIHSVLRDLDKKPVHSAASYSDPNYGDHIMMENIQYNHTRGNYRMSFGPDVIRKNHAGRLH